MQGPAWGWWVTVGAAGCLAACSSSGVVLESRRGDPAPSHDAGAGASMGEAGALTGMDSEGLRSGSRVHVSVYTSGGEFLSMRSAHDTLHDIDCEVAVAEDGVSRCIPALSSNVAFLDAACTIPVIFSYPGDTPPGCGVRSPPLGPFLSYTTDQPCPQAPAHVVQQGAEIKPTPDALYQSSGGSCGSGLVGEHVYSTTPSPPGDWVAFDRTVRTVTAELGVVEWSGRDGTRLPGDIRLLPADIPCEPEGVADAPLDPPSASGEYHCVPANRVSLANGELFSDPACTNVAATAPGCQPPPDLLDLVDQSTDPCGRKAPNLFAVGSTVPHSSVYTSLNGSCAPAAGLFASFTSYSMGAPVDRGTYPALQALASGTGRLQHWTWQVGGAFVAEASPGVWSDAASGANVQPSLYGDGITRGMFSTTFADPSFYADNACTKPLLGVEISQRGPTASPILDCSSGGVPRWAIVNEIGWLSPPPCEVSGGTAAFRPILGSHAGPVYTTDPTLNSAADTVCSEYAPSRNSFIDTFYDLGAAVPANSLFATIQIVDL